MQLRRVMTALGVVLGVAVIGWVGYRMWYYRPVPTGSILICCDGRLLVVDSHGAQAREVLRLADERQQIEYLSFDHVRRALALNTHDRLVWDLAAAGACAGSVGMLAPSSPAQWQPRKQALFWMISPSGTYWARGSYGDCGHQLTVTDRAGRPLAKLDVRPKGRPPRADIAWAPIARWSPDERMLALGLPDGHISVWYWRQDRELRVGRGFNPVWSPDSRVIAYNTPYAYSERGEIVSLGAMAHRQIRLPKEMAISSWSPDGTMLLLRSDDPDTHTAVVVAVRLADQREVWARIVGASQGGFQGVGTLWLDWWP